MNTTIRTAPVWRRLGLVFVAFALVVAACGDDDDSTASAPDGETETTETADSTDDSGSDDGAGDELLEGNERLARRLRVGLGAPQLRQPGRAQLVVRDGARAAELQP